MTNWLFLLRKSYMKTVSEKVFGWCLTFDAVYLRQISKTNLLMSLKFYGFQEAINTHKLRRNKTCLREFRTGPSQTRLEISALKRRRVVLSIKLK